MIARPENGQRVQMTLEMVPADLPDTGRPKVFRRWLIRDKAANLIDQLSLLTGKPKQEIIDSAICVVAIMYSTDPEQVSALLSQVDMDSVDETI
jgi:hypothetical protein